MKLTLTALVLIAAAGCHGSSDANSQAEGPANVPADNTGKNVRDRDDTVTPGDQSESATDRAITQQIRKDVVSRDELSVTGKNVKIITADGVVTLRGPVETAQEKLDIEQIAKKADGVKRLNSQLEIAAK